MHRAEHGNVALIFALALPPLAVAVVGGVQLSYVMSVKSSAQDVADSAALAGAEQMNLSPVGAAQRAQGWAEAQLASRTGGSKFTISAQAVDDHTLKVAIDTYTPSFFGDMLPAGGFRSHAEATAQQQAEAPLCVLIDGGSGDQLTVNGTSRLTGSCLVHGNGDVLADAGAAITATRVEAGRSASGPISPAAMTGAPTVTDPFAGMAIAFPACTPTHRPALILPIILPGVHPDDLEIPNNTIVTLAPGEHYFCGKVGVGNNATLQGSDVALFFDKDGAFETDPNMMKSAANISLSGRQSGSYAGFVIIAGRDVTSSFKIPTDPFAKITGAIYVPNAQLELDGSKSAASGGASDWTVIAARSLKVANANLQINTNYAGSQVYVPIGVGNNHAATSSGGAIKLVR